MIDWNNLEAISITFPVSVTFLHVCPITGAARRPTIILHKNDADLLCILRHYITVYNIFVQKFSKNFGDF